MTLSKSHNKTTIFKLNIRLINNTNVCVIAYTQTGIEVPGLLFASCKVTNGLVGNVVIMVISPNIIT